MAGVSPFVAPEGAGGQPLDRREPDVVHALADAVAILGPDFRPRIMLGRLGAHASFMRAEDLTARIADWVHQDDLATVLDALGRSGDAPGVDVEAQVRVHNDHDGWHDMTLVFR